MKKNLLINYWDTYYKNNKKIKESSFARFVIKKIDKNSKIIDIGCGNGRDSFFFSKNDLKVTYLKTLKRGISPWSGYSI